MNKTETPTVKRVPYAGKKKTRSRIQDEAAAVEANKMACFGAESRFIQSKTALSQGQVAYRLKRMGGSEARRAWRKGESALFYMAMQKLARVTEQECAKMIREHLNLQRVA